MFSVGDIVYFVETRGRECSIRYGVITLVDAGKYFIDFLKLREHRYVKGIPIEEFEGTEWKKIPKEWQDDYRKIETGLIYRLSAEEKAFIQEKRIDNPADLKELYDKGILVTADQITNWKIETEINRNKEYRIVRVIPAWTLTYGEDHRTYTHLPKKDIFTTYEEATQRAEEIKERWRTEDALTDEEWSIKEIDKVLRLFTDKERVKRWRAKLLSMDNIEELEIKKVDDNTVKWRYFSPRTEWKELVV